MSLVLIFYLNVDVFLITLLFTQAIKDLFRASMSITLLITSIPSPILMSKKNPFWTLQTMAKALTLYWDESESDNGYSWFWRTEVVLKAIWLEKSMGSNPAFPWRQTDLREARSIMGAHPSVLKPHGLQAKWKAYSRNDRAPSQVQADDCRSSQMERKFISELLIARPYEKAIIMPVTSLWMGSVIAGSGSGARGMGSRRRSRGSPGASRRGLLQARRGDCTGRRPSESLPRR